MLILDALNKIYNMEEVSNVVLSLRRSSVIAKNETIPILNTFLTFLLVPRLWLYERLKVFWNQEIMWFMELIVDKPRLFLKIIPQSEASKR